MLQGDTLAPYLFIVYLDYMLWTSIDIMKDNGIKLAKEKKLKIPWLHRASGNTHAQTETLLHSLKPAAAGRGLHVNADKTEYMCFNQRGDISTLNGSSLKLVDKFTYQGSSVSSTKTDINTWLAKVWAAIERLSAIWKSNLTHKINLSFFQAAVVSILLYIWIHYMDAWR